MTIDKTLELDWKHIRNRQYLKKVLEEKLSGYKGGKVEIAIRGPREDIDELAVAELMYVHGSIVDIYRRNHGQEEMKLHFISHSSLDKGLPEKIKINLDSLIDFECIPEEYHKRKVEKKYVMPPEEKTKSPWDEVKKIGDKVVVSWAAIQKVGAGQLIERYYRDYSGGVAKVQISGKRPDDGLVALSVFVGIYNALLRKATQHDSKSKPELSISLTVPNDSSYLVDKARISGIDFIDISY